MKVEYALIAALMTVLILGALSLLPSAAELTALLTPGQESGELVDVITAPCNGGPLECLIKL